MKLDTATIAFLLSFAAFLAFAWIAALSLEQGAQIQRLETSMRALCGARSPDHHSQACAEMSVPLAYKPR